MFRAKRKNNIYIWKAPPSGTKTKKQSVRLMPTKHKAHASHIKYQSVEEKSILVLPRIVVPLVTLESTVELFI